MDVIDQGAQYKVVDLGSGRVRKIPQTRAESQAVIESWYAPRKAPDNELAINYIQSTINSAKTVRSLLLKYPEISYSFGNPDFEIKGQYTQDKLPVLSNVLKKNSLQAGQLLIDNYINLILLHWQYGISERVFNCTVNNGVDNRDRIILLDFGEITTDKERVASGIVSQRWLKSWSYKNSLPEELREYYAHSMKVRLLSQRLEDSWATALQVRAA